MCFGYTQHLWSFCSCAPSFCICSVLLWWWSCNSGLMKNVTLFSETRISSLTVQHLSSRCSLNPSFGVFAIGPAKPQQPCTPKSPSVHSCPVAVRGSLLQRCNCLNVSLRKKSFIASTQSLLHVGNNHNRHCQAGHGSACMVSVEERQHESTLYFLYAHCG